MKAWWAKPNEEVHSKICKSISKDDAENAAIQRTYAKYPMEINNHDHSLIFLSKPPYRTETCTCHVCRRPWSGPVYHCSSCLDFDIDVLCALPEELQIRTHHHPVRLMRRRFSFKCHGCHDDRDDDGEAYVCTKPSCEFRLHKECVLLPRVLLRSLDHAHPLRLSYGVPGARLRTCVFCHSRFGQTVPIYYCLGCTFFAHSNCISGLRSYATQPPPPSKESSEGQSYDLLKHELSKEMTILARPEELPKQIDHPMHSRHPLVLLPKPPYPSKTCKCQVCKMSCKNPVYHCSSCKFDVHTLCALVEDAGHFEIPAHHHPVRLMRRPASFICNACDGKRDDQSYICVKPSCGFWVHRECGSLPEKYKHPEHDHSLFLDVGLQVRYQKYNLSCEICHDDLQPSDWVYYCRRCIYIIHFKCIRDKNPIQPESGYRRPYKPRLEMIRLCIHSFAT